jgi:hypothetical protein
MSLGSAQQQVLVFLLAWMMTLKLRKFCCSKYRSWSKVPSLGLGGARNCVFGSGNLITPKKQEYNYVSGYSMYMQKMRQNSFCCTFEVNYILRVFFMFLRKGFGFACC